MSSTTFVTEEVKIRRPAGPKGDSAGGASGSGRGAQPRPRGWLDLPRKDWRRATGLTLRYVHGPDPQIEVRARGRTWRYPWDTAVLDILADVCARFENRNTDRGRGGWRV